MGVDRVGSNADQPADQNAASAAPAAPDEGGANSKRAKVAFMVGMSIDATGRKGLTLQSPTSGTTARLDTEKLGEVLPRGFEGTISIQLSDDPTTRVALSVSADASGVPKVDGATVNRAEVSAQDARKGAAPAAAPPMTVHPNLTSATFRIKPKTTGTWTVLQSAYFMDKHTQLGAQSTAVSQKTPNRVEDAFYAIGQIVATRFRDWFDTAEPSIARGFLDGLNGEGQPATLPTRAVSSQLQLQLHPHPHPHPHPLKAAQAPAHATPVQTKPAQPTPLKESRVDPAIWASLGPGKYGSH